MRHCTKCQLIYDEHASKCDKCDGGLITFQSGHDIHDHNFVFPEGAAWVVLESTLAEYEAQSHVDYLKSLHIPALKVLNENGVMLEVYMGNSVYGFDVLVPEKILAEAKEALETFLNAPFEDIDELQ